MQTRVVAVCVVLCFTAITCTREETIPTELRGVWLSNVDSRILESRDGIRKAMEFIKSHNFNAVFPVVWSRSATLFPSSVMDSVFGTPIDSLYSGRDPLAEIVEEAHARGIAVIPRFEQGFVASYGQNDRSILQRKPAWAELDSDRKFLSKNGFEWMSPFHPEVESFLLGLMLEVVRRYDVDGIQGDDRLPALPIEGGYSTHTQEAYRREHQGEAPPKDYREPEWVRWRVARLNAFAERVYRDVKALKPDVIVSWAPSIYPWSFEEYLQDWPGWVRATSADMVIPQVYRKSVEEYRQTLVTQSPDSLELVLGNTLMFPGIPVLSGSYVIPEDSLIAMVENNRKMGYYGEVYFSYEGLRMNNDALARALHRRFYQSPARIPLPAFQRRMMPQG